MKIKDLKRETTQKHEEMKGKVTYISPRTHSTFKQPHVKGYFSCYFVSKTQRSIMKARPEDPIKPSRLINNSHASVGHPNKTKSLSHSTKYVILQQETKQHEVKFITCKV